MKDDSSVISTSSCAEWSLMPDSYSVHDLKTVNACAAHHMKKRTLECPIISPVEEPVSIMNAWPNLTTRNR